MIIFPSRLGTQGSWLLDRHCLSGPSPEPGPGWPLKLTCWMRAEQAKPAKSRSPAPQPGGHSKGPSRGTFQVRALDGGKGEGKGWGQGGP